MEPRGLIFNRAEAQRLGVRKRRMEERLREQNGVFERWRRRIKLPVSGYRQFRGSRGQRKLFQRRGFLQINRLMYVPE